MLKDLIGVIACGGYSSRMKTDKSLLNYHGLPQRYHLYELLLSLCGHAAISCNKFQSSGIPETYNIIPDDPEFEGKGPMAGLLSAFKKHPGKSIAYVGCDYPYLELSTLQKLTEKKDGKSPIICFKNYDAIPEPLIAIYEYHCYPSLLNQFRENNYSLRDFIKRSDAIILPAENESILKSVDTPEQYQKEIETTKKERS